MIGGCGKMFQFFSSRIIGKKSVPISRYPYNVSGVMIDMIAFVINEIWKLWRSYINLFDTTGFFLNIVNVSSLIMNPVVVAVIFHYQSITDIELFRSNSGLGIE